MKNLNFIHIILLWILVVTLSFQTKGLKSSHDENLATNEITISNLNNRIDSLNTKVLDLSSAYKNNKLSYSDFDSPDSPRSGLNMDNTFLLMLGEAEAVSQLKFHITSGFRTCNHTTHLQQLGYPASTTSYHKKGKAADILALTKSYKKEIVRALRDVGFTDIIIYPKHIHVAWKETHQTYNGFIMPDKSTQSIRTTSITSDLLGLSS